MLRIVDAVSALEGAGAREKEPLDVSDSRVSAPVQETRVHETDYRVLKFAGPVRT
jgi:hypothetical protein